MPAINPRRAMAVIAGKSAAWASRLLNRGGGTAFPGVVAGRLDPGLTRALAQQLNAGTVTISGTNGKTTTARLLAGILGDAGFTPVRNDAGSNLMRGLTSSLVKHARLSGNLDHDPHAIGVFEVDEAALPGVLAVIRPTTILLLDLFRDQLDRYGEVATIARLWSTALQGMAPSTLLVANADDPLLVVAAQSASTDVRYFGIDSAHGPIGTLDYASDVKACPRCGGEISYTRVTFGHLGEYACSRCDVVRPSPDLTARNIRLQGVRGATFTLDTGDSAVDVELPLPGMYNVYNALAAAAVARTRGISLDRIASSLRAASPAFGRMERVRVGSRELVIALAKNPAGLNEVLRTIAGEGEKLHLLALLNDRIADGHDVSWIWDAEVEMLAGRVETIGFSGIRAADMALRFKYAGALPVDAGNVQVEEEIAPALDRAIQSTPAGGRLFVLPTYTAMLAVRAELARRGHVQQYWDE